MFFTFRNPRDEIYKVQKGLFVCLYSLILKLVVVISVYFVFLACWSLHQLYFIRYDQYLDNNFMLLSTKPIKRQTSAKITTRSFAKETFTKLMCVRVWNFFLCWKKYIFFTKGNRTKGYSVFCITTSCIFHYKSSPNIKQAWASINTLKTDSVS